jgi:aminoglycoside phosphotransferase (APT) family kinase protein
MKPAPNTHEPLPPITAVSLIPGLVSVLLPDLAADEPIPRTPGPSSAERAPLARFRAVTDLPDDPKLPALVALRDACRTDAPPEADLDGRTIEFLLCGFSPGTRATFEARAGSRRLAVKAYAEDAAPEAALYEALAAAGLGGDSGARVPPLLFWERDLRVLVIGWLEGPTAHQLVKDGRGARAGELAADWLQRAAAVSVPLGPPFGAQRIQTKVGNWVSTLHAADPTLGTAATAVAARLERTQPREAAPRLVHGTFYARHVFDLGDGPGVIDWQRFGQGPLELDAGMFLATIGRVGLDHGQLAGEAALAEDAFLAGTRDLLDERALGWFRATSFLHLAARRVRHPERHRPERLVERAQSLLGEAARHAKAAG